MAPRKYDLGARAPAVADTRRRILTAAAEEMREHGLDRTSFQAIARRADVAPGTVAYHFRERERLVEAVVEHLLEVIEHPTVDVIDPAAPLPARLRALLTALYRLWEQSAEWMDLYARNKDVEGSAALAAGAAHSYEVVHGMTTATLGPLARDKEARVLLGSLITPEYYASVVRQGVSTDEAVELALALILPWLKRRQARSARR